MDKIQFSMVLVNKRGELARFAEVLAGAGVNIEALAISDGVHTGVLKVVVDDPDAARAAFTEAKLSFSEQPIRVMALENKPGALAEICGKLAESGFSINYVYGSTCTGGQGSCKPQLMVSVSDAGALDAVEDAALWPGP